MRKPSDPGPAVGREPGHVEPNLHKIPYCGHLLVYAQLLPEREGPPDVLAHRTGRRQPLQFQAQPPQGLVLSGVVHSATEADLLLEWGCGGEGHGAHGRGESPIAELGDEGGV